MADVFSRTEVQWGGAMTAQTGIIVPNKGLTGLLMQNYGLQYSQNVTRVFELGRAGQPIQVYLIAGRAQGTLQAAHIVGPGSQMKAFYASFSDPCQAQTNDFKFQLGANICAGAAAEAVSYKAKYCVLQSIGINVAAQDFIINESSMLTFSGLEYA